MNAEILAVADFLQVVDDGFSETASLDLGGWCVSIGIHPLIPGPVLLAHIEDRAILITLDDPCHGAADASR
jgi:hypothetical protein